MKWKQLKEVAAKQGVDLELPQLPIDGKTSCLCFWSDVLGFGSKCVEYAWDLDRMNQEGVFSAFQWLWLHSKKERSEGRSDIGLNGEYVQGINDGVVRGVDISDSVEDGWRVFRYIHYLVGLHHSLNDHIEDAGMLGAISVLALGERLIFPDDASFKEILDKAIPSAFNMNTAFSYAYTIESSGRTWGSEAKSLYLTEESLHFLKSVKGVSQETNENVGLFYLNCGLDDKTEPVYGVTLAVHLNPIPFKSKLFATRLYKMKYSNEWDSFSGEHQINL